MARPDQNLIDRAIDAVAPGWALKRMRSRAIMAMAGGYISGGRGARPALANWAPGNGDADADIAPDLVDLRAYTRDLARTSPIGAGAINTVVTNVVGTGLAAQPTPDFAYLGIFDEEKQKAWLATTQREWLQFCESTDCDITRHQNFYGLQALAFRSILESGDIGIIPTRAARPGAAYSLALQLIEADRISNPNWQADTAAIVQGVEMDATGAPQQYHIASRHPGARQRAGTSWSPVAAFTADGRRNFLHIFERRRPGQTRGVPYLAGVIEPLKQLTRYAGAELSAAVASAVFAVFIKMDPEAFGSLFDDDGRDRYLKSAKGWNGGLQPADINAGGKVVNLLPGESAEAPEVGRPNVNFDPFFLAMVRQIGVSLELPFEVLIKHFTSSYTAARASLLDAWRFFRGRRDFLAAYLCQPVYELWLEEAIATGRIAAPGYFADPVIRRAWGQCLWTGDGPGSVDPLKEVDAAVARIENNLSTVAAESLLLDGISWDSKAAQRQREVKAFAAAGITPGQPSESGPTPSGYPSDHPN